MRTTCFPLPGRRRRRLAAVLILTALSAPASLSAGDRGDPLGPGLYRLQGSDPSLPHDDLAPLRRIVGNARFVGLGEAAHTSGGFYEMKHRLFRYLVEEMGFRALGFESPWINAERVARYVQTCQGSPEEAIRGLFTVYQSTEVRDLARWMCEWNQAHPDDPVHFYGFDIQNQALRDAEALIAFLQRIGVDGGDPRIAGIRACDGVDESFFPLRRMPGERYRQCQDALSAVAALFDEEEKEIERRTSPEELGWARVHLAGERAGQEFAFALARGDFAGSYAARDRGMAYMAEAIPALRFPKARVALFAHNGHVTRDGQGHYALTAMGNFLDASLGRSYVVIAQTAWDLQMDWPRFGRCGRHIAVGERPIEDFLHGIGESYLLLDLGPRGSHPPFLAPEVPWSIGDSYAAPPSASFDALIYQDVSPKMHPLAWPSCR